MPFAVDIITQAAPIGTGIQDFVGSMGGATPVAYILLMSKADALDDEQIGAAHSQGFSDGTREFCMGIRGADNVGTTSTGRTVRNDAVMYLMFSTSNTAEFIGVHSAFSANTVTVDWTTVGSTGWMVTCIMFSGLSAYAGSFKCLAPIDTNHAITAPSFQPNFFYGLTGQRDFSGNNNNAKWSQGMAVEYDSTIKQGCMYGIDRRNLATSDNQGVIRNDRIGGTTVNEGGSRYTLQFIQFDANGFTYQMKEGSDDDEDYAYLVLQFPTDEVNLLEITTPTSTGNKTYTGMGFPSRAVMMFGCRGAAYNTWYTSGEMGSPSYSVFNTSAAVSHYWTSEDNVATSRIRAGVFDDATYIKEDDGTLRYQGSYVSMESDGFKINYTTVEGSAHKGFALGIKAVAAVVISEADTYRGTRRGIVRGVQ